MQRHKFVSAALVIGLTTLLMASTIARADDVTDWNQHVLRAGTVGGTSPLVMSRVAAIVQASVFDAVNGIDRKYTPVHVPPAGDADASRRAAVVEAAYTALVALYPPSSTVVNTATYCGQARAIHWNRSLIIRLK
jgi:hypothetical protein